MNTKTTKKAYVVKAYDIRNLAQAELRQARLLDNHVQLGFAQVPEDKLWEWFLQRLTSLEGAARRQGG